MKRYSKYTLTGLLVAILLAAPACSNDEMVTRNNKPTETESVTHPLKLAFEGVTLPQNTTKAIATSAENEVKEMLIIMVSADIYEIWESTNSDGEVTEKGDITRINRFKLTASDGNKRLTATLPTSLSGERMVMIATNGLGFMNNSGDILTPQGLLNEILAGNSLASVWTKPNGEGNYDYAAALDLTTDRISTPLLMASSNTDGYVSDGESFIGIALYRSVARFDLQNKLQDKVLITSIQPKNASINLSDDDRGNMLAVDMPGKDDIEALGSSTAWTAFTSGEHSQANLTSLFYTYPSSLNEDQPMYFAVKARVIDGETITNKDYFLRLTRNNEEIDINNNTRYIIVIDDVKDNTLTASIRIANWEADDAIDGNVPAGSKIVPAIEGAEITDVSTWTTVSDMKVVTVTALASDPNPEVQFKITNASDFKLTATSTEDDIAKVVSFDLIPEAGITDNTKWLNTPAVVMDGVNIKVSLDVNSTAGIPTGPILVRVKNKMSPENYQVFKAIYNIPAMVP